MAEGAYYILKLPHLAVFQLGGVHLHFVGCLLYTSGGFFCELGFVKAEQANHGAAQLESILVHLPAGYLAILQCVFCLLYTSRCV